MVTPARFERAAPGLGIRCSILLSYGVTRQCSRREEAGRSIVSHEAATDRPEQVRP